MENSYSHYIRTKSQTHIVICIVIQGRPQIFFKGRVI